MKIVHIKWIDSIHSSGWQSRSSFESFSKEPILHLDSVGFLAWEHEDYVVIVQSAGPDDIDAMMKIPRCAITEIREIGEVDIKLDKE